jgi:hypothetical protein
LTLVATGSGYQGMTRQQYVDAKRRPGEATFTVYKFFPAPETRAGASMISNICRQVMP